MPIKVGDAVMEFLGDTTKLDATLATVRTRTADGLRPAAAEATKLTKGLTDAAGAFKAAGDASMKWPEFFNKNMKDAVRIIGSSKDAMRELGKQFRDMKEAARVAEELKQAMERQQKAAEKLAKEQAHVSNIVRQMREESAAATAQSKLQTDSMNKLGTTFSGVGIKLGSLVKGFIAFRAAMELKELAAEALDFGKAFAEVTSIMDTQTPRGRAEIAKLREEILNMNPALGDATELTRGLYEAISSGVKPAEAIQFVGEAALFAKASLTDTFNAVDVITSVINAYGKEASEAKNVSAALFETINLGKTRGPELADSLGRVIPIAASLKVNLSEVLAAVATLTLAGLDTDEAMTALRGSMNALLSPSSEAEKMAKELGIDLRVMREELKDKGLAAVLGEMAQKTAGSADATAALFGNVRALNGVLTLTGPQAARYNEILKKIADAEREGTATATAANAIFASQGEQLAIMGREFKTQFIKAFEDGKPIIDTFVQALKMIAVDGGGAKLVLGAIGVTLAVVATVFQGFVLTTNLVGAALAGLTMLIIKAASHIPILNKYVNESGHAYVEMQAALKGFTEQATDAGQAIVDINNATGKLIRGTKESTTATKENTSARDATIRAAKAEAEAIAEAARKKAEDARQAKEAAKAVQAYAKAHGIELVGELKQGAAAATAFYQMLQRQNAPLSEQNSAWLNMTKAVAKYHTAIDETRNALQKMYDTARAKPVETTQSKIPEVIPQTAGMKALQELEDGFAKLGVSGETNLLVAKVAAEQAFEAIKNSGVASYNDILIAQEALLDKQIEYSQVAGDTTALEAQRSALAAVHKEMERLGITTTKLTHIERQWMQFWQRDAIKMKDIGKAAFMGLAQGIGAAVSAAETGADGFGEAMQKMLASVLSSISGQAAIEAIMEIALAIKCAANPLWAAATGQTVGGHLIAAAKFAAVSAAAGLAASALSGGGRSGSQSDAAQGTEQQPQSAAATPEPQPVTRQNVQRFAAGALITRPTLAVLGDAQQRALSASSKGEAAIPLDDDRALDNIGGSIGAHIKQANGGNVFYIEGVISDDKLDRVIAKINKRVRQNDVHLDATVARRVERR
jgi:TP901 family phage tail tape measure protein